MSEPVSLKTYFDATVLALSDPRAAELPKILQCFIKPNERNIQIISEDLFSYARQFAFASTQQGFPLSVEEGLITALDAQQTLIGRMRPEQVMYRSGDLDALESANGMKTASFRDVRQFHFD